MPGNPIPPLPGMEKTEPPLPSRTRIRTLLLAGIVCTLVPGALYGFSDTIVNWLLVHNDPMRPVDVLLVGHPDAIETSKRLLDEGMVQTILVSGPPPPGYTDEGSPVSFQYFTMRALLEAGIDEHAVAGLPRAGTTLLDTHQVLRDWMLENNADSLLVHASRLNSGFTKSLLSDTLDPAGISVVVQARGPLKGIWRKNILGLQNMMIEWAYWKWNYRDHIRRESAALRAGNPVEE